VVDSTSPDEAVRDQMFQILDLRSEGRLGSDHAQDPFCPSECSHFLSLGQAIAERPFTIDVFARFDRCLRDLQVMGHLHRDGNDVDLRRRDKFGDVGEGSR